MLSSNRLRRARLWTFPSLALGDTTCRIKHLFFCERGTYRLLILATDLLPVNLARQKNRVFRFFKLG
jgi:hypothetical protein